MTDRLNETLDRREFVTRSAEAVGGIVAAAALPWEARAAEPAAGSRQAMGMKIGEVTDHSALIWTRLTAAAARNTTGQVVEGRVDKKTKNTELPQKGEGLHGSCPGAPGRIRVRYSRSEDLAKAVETPWADVSAKSDFSHQFPIADLEPAATYHISVETEGAGGEKHAPVRGRFETAPRAADAADISFCVNTCIHWADRDKGEDDGMRIFDAMSNLNPKFICFTGDNVYYDSDEPRAFNQALARYHWQRMFSLPRHVESINNVATYWEKDDHDTQSNDSWPGGKPYGTLTFEQGQAIFRQQVPLKGLPYRTYRWGKHLQIWLTDGRDFRSPNNIPDGPAKTIWGPEQRAWLEKTLLESDATWKILVTPTPIVGPDRPNKNDNHANATYTYEGGGFRSFIQKNCPSNFFAITGDRHWQYHSIHPETKVQEFACGPASNRHASGTPGLNPAFHKFHLVRGGFVSVTVTGGAITFRHHDVNGKVVYEYKPA